jgi:hypothetical protein
MLISQGYRSEADIEEVQRDWQLFSQNIDLLRRHEESILSCRDYFFCHPAFASCSWSYLEGDGPLLLGYLLLGWRAGLLSEDCSDFKSQVLITSFAGSPLSGANTWTGLCLCCREKRKGQNSRLFRQWMDFILKLRKMSPAMVEMVEQHDGFKFSWGGNGLKPVIKKIIVSKPVAEPITLSALIGELKSGYIRGDNAININLCKKHLELKPFSR